MKNSHIYKQNQKQGEVKCGTITNWENLSKKGSYRFTKPRSIQNSIPKIIPSDIVS
jgi:hypothetical protein